MSASITEAHRKLAYELMQMDDRLSAFAHRTAAQLIANSEARAVAAAVTALTCTHHNDQQRVACPVCLVTAPTAERDKLRAQNDQFSDNLSAVGAVYNAETARAERAEAELASERGRLERELHESRNAERLARVQLGNERARLRDLWCEMALEYRDERISYVSVQITRSVWDELDAAMKEGA